jgi:hypothetical protein
MSKKILLIVFGIFLFTSPVSAETYNLSLKPGENLISLPLIPQDTNIASILSPITAQVKDVWEFNPSDTNDPWKHYQPGMERYSDLTQMDVGKGYWINVKTNVTLQITGTPVPQNYILSLKTGWDVIGWPYQYSQGITAALIALNLATDYTQVSKLNSSTKAQENFLNQPIGDNVTTFEPGNAYYIYMLNDKIIQIGLSGPVDTTPPTGIITINDGNEYTNLTSVSLNLSATDSGSGMGTDAQMSFSNDNINWSVPENYTTSKTWILLLGDGTKTVYVKYKDAAGNWSSAVSDTIILDSAIPQISGLVPLNHSTFYENEVISILPAVANNPGSSPLEYQFSIDGAIKQPWSGQSQYDWQGVAGIHNLKVEVRDVAGQDSKQIEICVFNNPIGPPS